MNNYSVKFHRTNLEIYEYDVIASTQEEAVQIATRKLFAWYDNMDPSEITEIDVSSAH